jgi:carbon-monoxide dehydrogenase large subunit
MVGDYIALIIAETLAQAKDAAEAIEVGYEALPVVAVATEALRDGAPAIWDDNPDNICYYHEQGDKPTIDAVFAAAAHVVCQDLWINRVSANSMEPRGALGVYDAFEDRYTLYSGLQTPHRNRADIANNILHIPETKMRVVANDVGGSFGMKGGTYREQPLVLWAAKKVGRPVKWLSDRSEALLTDNHARDNQTTAELALDADGKILGLRVKTVVNVGGQLSSRGPHSGIANLGTLSGTYVLPSIYVQVTGAFTNSGSTSAYRGAGRPEAAYVIERMLDIAADEMKIDPAEIRRRNTIPRIGEPYDTGFIFTYDSGDFGKNMEIALEMADYNGFEARRAEVKTRGKLRGIGISNTIEQAAGKGYESAQIRFSPTGAVTLLLGTISHGQGHETVFTQVLCDQLGIDPAKIRVVEGDTDQVTTGTGTFGSRSAALAGSAIKLAADKVINKAKTIAAHILEASSDDIEFADGAFRIAGTDRETRFDDIAALAYNGDRLPLEIEPGLDETAIFNPAAPNFPNGCHVVEAEIDPDTGKVELVKYSIVDDVGVTLNPPLLKGQIHGGIAMGMGQALMEDVNYDPKSGQLRSGSFMDYCMPRADNFCTMEVVSNNTPTPTNPLGVKGAGEAGTVGSIPAVVNAVVDALSPLGIKHVDMPLTSERVWRAIREARNSK